MKEAFWGVLIVMLGLLGIVIVNVFQKVTVKNDEVYYLIKEVTEASAYDAIDLTYYRLNGDIRIVEDKFVENLTRRFAENVTSYGDYTIVVEEVNETPPKVSLRVRTEVSSLQGEKFGISNRVDAIIETKYSKQELLDFLGITEEEWNNISGGSKDACSIKNLGDDIECIDGDIEFRGWEDQNIQNNVCSINDITANQKKRKAIYAMCECGKWKEETKEIDAIVTQSIGQIVFTWNLNVDGELRSLNEKIEKRVKLDICTTGLEIWVPEDLRKKEPSSDNSKYVKCGVEGIRIPNTKYNTLVLHAGYIPTNATNRSISNWLNNNDRAVDMPTLLQVKIVRSDKGFAKATIEGKIANEEATITVTNSFGQSGVCKVKVWDGTVDSVSCTDKTLTVGLEEMMKSSYEPYNASETDFTWSISDTSIATIDSSTGKVTAKKAGTANVTITAKGGKTGTCKVTVNCPSGQTTNSNCASSCSCGGSCTNKGNGCYVKSCKSCGGSGGGSSSGGGGLKCKCYSLNKKMQRKLEISIPVSSCSGCGCPASLITVCN